MKDSNFDKLTLDCAALSLHVYDADSNSNSLPPDGWSVFLPSNSTHGYRGVCYIDSLTDPTSIIFAHRGTVLTYTSNLWYALEVAMGNIPVILVNDAFKFINEAWEKMVENYPEQLDKIKVIQTGHSLGAILADMCHVGMNVRELNETPTVPGLATAIPTTTQCITFENPGSKPIAEKYLKEIKIPANKIEGFLGYIKSQSTCYQANFNIINTCNEQIPMVYRLDLPYRLDINPYFFPSFPFSATAIFNTFYVISNTEDQHEMKNLLTHMQKGCDVNMLAIDLFGFQEGYVYYLSTTQYLNLGQYWQDYFKEAWIHSPDHEKYKSVGEFQAHFGDLFNRIYEDARKELVQAKIEESSLRKFGIFKSGNESPSSTTIKITRVTKEFILDPLEEFVLIEDSQKNAEEKPKPNAPKQSFCPVM